MTNEPEIMLEPNEYEEDTDEEYERIFFTDWQDNEKEQTVSPEVVLYYFRITENVKRSLPYETPVSLFILKRLIEKLKEAGLDKMLLEKEIKLFQAIFMMTLNELLVKNESVFPILASLSKNHFLLGLIRQELSEWDMNVFIHIFSEDLHNFDKHKDTISIDGVFDGL